MGPSGAGAPAWERGLSDDEIVRMVIGGDVDLFEELINRHRDRVFRIVSRRAPACMARELAHDVFVKAYTSLPSFETGRSFENWISGIAVRVCYAYWRARYRSREVTAGALSDDARSWLEKLASGQSIDSFKQVLKLTEVNELLGWALEQIGPEERAVLELVHLEGRSVREAASLLGWSVPNVKVRSFRARKKLRRLLCELLGRKAG